MPSRPGTRPDRCVHAGLSSRRVAGLRTVRGSRSLFSDAPFARAWWRVHTVRRIAEGCSAAEQNRCHAVLRTSPDYWERIVSMIVSRASVYGSVEVQAALITELAVHAGKHPATSVLKVPVLTRLLRRISNIAAEIELAALDPEGLAVIFREQMSRLDPPASE